MILTFNIYNLFLIKVVQTRSLIQRRKNLSVWQEKAILVKQVLKKTYYTLYKLYKSHYFTLVLVINMLGP